ncbi:hypothetical protein GGH97_006139, partial [Coemansia sp. RSA 475]
MRCVRRLHWTMSQKTMAIGQATWTTQSTWGHPTERWTSLWLLESACPRSQTALSWIYLCARMR